MIEFHFQSLILTLLLLQSPNTDWSNLPNRLQESNVVFEESDQWYLSQNRDSAMYYIGYIEGRFSIRLSNEFRDFLKSRFEGGSGRNELFPLISESRRIGEEMGKASGHEINGTSIDTELLDLKSTLLPAVTYLKTKKGIAIISASSISGHGSICFVNSNGKQLWKLPLVRHRSQRQSFGRSPTDWYCSSMHVLDERLVVFAATQSAILLDIYDSRNGTSLFSVEFLHKIDDREKSLGSQK